MKYNEIIKQAKNVKNNAEKKQKKPNGKWSYYFAKSILKPETDIPNLKFDDAIKSTGDHFSRQIRKSEYLDMAKRLITYIEKNERLPNYISVAGKNMMVSDYTYMFSRILVYLDKHEILPKYANVNSKVWIKPTETGNVVYDYFSKVTGKKFKYIDDFLDYCKNNYRYEFYFDDRKSNKQVIDEEAGNCTDLLQMCVNMAIAMGYEWKVIHTKCKQSGTGHVYGKFRKNGGSWFIRDIACIVDEERSCVWCNVDTGAGYQLAVNPSWFMSNLNR